MAKTSKGESSTSVDDNLKLIFLDAAIELLAYPIIDTVIIEPFGTASILKDPSSPVDVPNSEPSTTTFAPTRGSPVFKSVTDPLTLTCATNTADNGKDVRPKTRAKRFIYISFGFLTK